MGIYSWEAIVLIKPNKYEYKVQSLGLIISLIELKGIDAKSAWVQLRLTIDLHHRLTSRTLHLKHLNDYLWLNDVLQDWQKRNYQFFTPILSDR